MSNQVLLKSDLSNFKLNKHRNLDIFRFDKESLQANSSLADLIVKNCEYIQDQVWTKKFDTSQNSVDQDILLLVWDDFIEQPIGFYSASYIKSKEGLFLYHSDGMVLPQYWGKGLLTCFFQEANSFGAQKYNQNKLINIVATGYLYMLSCFENKKQYSRIEWPLETKILNIVKEIIHESFENLPMDKNGIIRSAWKKQKNNMKDVWPEELAKKYKFPVDVNYFMGDVLVRLYLYDHNKLVTK